MGDRITISGNIQNSNLNIKSTLTNVQQKIGALPGSDRSGQEELQALIGQLQQVLEGIPEDLKEQAEAVAASAQALVENARASSPNKTLLEINGEGLKQAAGAIGSAAPGVVSIAAQIVTAVLHIRGFA
jgi:hypothetical protein